MRPGPNWFFGYAEDAFRRHLLPLAGTPIQVLQIGAYLGDASEWLLTNVLTEPGSWLVDVDTWEGSNEAAHEAINFMEVQAFYDERMKNYHRVGRYVGTSDNYFGQHPPPFDFIYIDGAHTSEQVLRDAVNADRFLNVGGMIAFDDYCWSDGSGNIPRPAIDAFLTCYGHRYEVLEQDLQVWVRRIK